MKKLVVLVAVAVLVAFAAPAFAANPFMDVPMNHWAYDAISQLSAQGIVSGYPDGTFKGNAPMTRYEMASIVARALAVVDMNKASKQDVEMLKRLVVEFKDELDALGVKVDELDSRVAVLEENLGGWALNGEYELRFRSFDESDEENLYFDDARITMSKQIDDKVKFVGRFENQGSDLVGGFTWEKFYLDVMLPYDVNMRVGRAIHCWLGRLVNDNDSICGDFFDDGFMFTKAFSMGEVGLFIGHEEAADTKGYFDGLEYWTFEGKADFNFNEQFSAGLWAQMFTFDAEDVDDLVGIEVDSLAWYAGWLEFVPMDGVSMTGAYYMNNFDVPAGIIDDAAAWQVFVKVDQDVFGFTSFLAEYWAMDEGFGLINDPFANYAFDVVLNSAYTLTGPSGISGAILDNDTTALFIKATQAWNDKWSTFQRYVNVDQDFADDEVTNMTFGVGYNYTSNLYFELVYDDIDYGNNADDDLVDDSMIQFKTYVSF